VSRYAYEGDGTAKKLVVRATWLHWLFAIGVWGVPFVALGSGAYILAAVLVVPVALLDYRLVTQRLVLDHAGMRVRGVLTNGWYPWGEIQGFRVIDHTRGVSVATMGLAGSSVVAMLRGGDKRLTVTTSVAGVDQTGDGTLIAQTLAREFERLRPT
jgi:hypothetical protein